MTCDEAKVLLHALLDGELDAGHARDVEAHVDACPRCAAQLRDYRAMRAALGAPSLREPAPQALRRRIEASLPTATPAAPTRRAMLKGFGLGAAFSAAAAAGIALVVVRLDQDDRLLGDVVSAHLRSLQADRLTDVVSSDQHTVRPWFNGRLDVAPPVVDLKTQGFTLLGGRVDYIAGKAVAAIVYRHDAHVINLFVTPDAGSERGAARQETVRGFNVRRWTDRGLRFVAISDVNADELRDFGTKLDAALQAGG